MSDYIKVRRKLEGNVSDLSCRRYYVDSDQTRNLPDLIISGDWFDSKHEAQQHIEREDPKNEFAWDIYEVTINCVESL